MSRGIMIRPCRARTATVLCVVCLLTSGAYAQWWEQYSVSLHTSIVGGRYLGTPPRTWELYREDMTEVELSFALSNEGENTLFFNSAIVERAIGLQLFSMDEATGELQETPVSVTARGVVDQDGIGPFITAPDYPAKDFALDIP